MDLLWLCAVGLTALLVIWVLAGLVPGRRRPPAGRRAVYEDDGYAD